MKRSSPRALRVVLAALCAVLFVACSDSETDPTLVAAGTGSSGGNPAIVTFQLTTDDATEDSIWNAGNSAAAVVVFARTDETGECEFSDEELPLGAFIDLVRDNATELDGSKLCRIGFRPASDEPLVSVSGEFRGRGVEVLLYLPSGIDLVFDEPLPPLPVGEPQEIVVSLSIARLIRDIDLAGLVPPPGETLHITDQDDGDGLLLLESLIDALAIYRDPTPGDRRITAAERTPENRIGFIELP